MVVYEDGAPEPIRLFDHGVVYEDPETFGEYHLSYLTGDVVSPQIDSSEPLELELADFAHAIRTGASPRASGALARDVVAIVQAAQRSFEAGGAAVPLEALVT
jgi:predicted dehydrogenase